MFTVISTLETIAVTAIVTAITTTCVIYIYLLRPAQERGREFFNRSHKLAVQLTDERTLRSDIVKWIEHECRAYKAVAVESALKQRIKRAT